MSDVEFVEKEAGNLDALAGLGKPAPDSVTLLVPKGCSRETALMSVLEQVVELLLPLEKAGKDWADNYTGRVRAVEWLAEKYGGKA